MNVGAPRLFTISTIPVIPWGTAVARPTRFAWSIRLSRSIP